MTQPETARLSAVWIDGDPLMEAIAATVWEHCARDDEDMPQAVCDDPRTIAAFAAAVARADAAAAPSAARAACPDPIECSHEAALGQAQQDVRRLGLMVDEYGAGASALTSKLKRVRDLHRETCVVAQGVILPPAAVCGMCELLDQPAPPMPAPADPAASTAPLAAGLPLVQGRCPACGTAGLFLGDGGYVTCSLIDCPEPDAATTMLEREAPSGGGAVFDRIRAMHQPVEGLGYASDEDDTPGSYGHIAQVCSTCGKHDEYGVRWPCTTVRVIDEEMRRMAAARATPPVMDRAAKAEALLLHFTVEAHRRKWEHDRGLDDDGIPLESEAFNALHQLGEEMRVEVEKLQQPAVVEPAEAADTDTQDAEARRG